MKKHIPNFITCLNLVTGALGCITILQGDFHLAIYFVIVSGLFDFMDGFAARILGVQSAIGKELDSLADMISFGLLPALYMVMLIRDQEPINEYLAFSGLLIVVFSAIRLARFNIDDRQTDHFIGLPTPANTVLITSLTFLPAAFQLSILGLLIFTVVSSLLLVANLPLIALKFKGVSWAANKWKYLLMMVVIGLLAALQDAALPLIIPVYLIISIVGNLSTRSSV